MHAANVRVVRAENSLQSFHQSKGYCHEPIVYVQEPRRSYADPRSHADHLRTQRRSCANRFCIGICNFFNRLRPADLEEHHYYNSHPPALCFVPPNSRSKGHMQCISSHVPALNSGQEYSKKENFDLDTNSDYIIYVPRVSKSKLAKDYVQPLCNANYEPIVIQQLASKFGPKCECYSCEQNIAGCHSHDRSTVIMSHRRKRKPHTSCHYSPLDTFRCDCDACAGANRAINGKFSKCPNADSRAHGDSEDLNDHLTEKKSEEYELEAKKSYPRSPHLFSIKEKTISWSVIQQRHDTARKNREKRLHEVRNKFLISSSIWTRRRLIAQQKKKLAKDNNSVICPPPNMLESRFHHIHWLGKSGNLNNTVGRYYDKEENRAVALKIFSNKPFDTIVENLDNKLMAIQEVNSLRKMECKNIVKLLGYFELHDKYHLILESCDHSLRNEIEDAPSGLGTSTSKKIVRHILNGLHYCHQKKCLHRDLSPENILVCKNGQVKIADFDRSVFVTDGIGNISPTPGSYVYNSPEILAGDKEYGLPSDVWSLGIIFCELLTGKTPWNGTSSQSQLREIHNCVGPLLPRHASVAKLHIDEKSYTVHNHAQLQQMFTTISVPCCSFIMKCLDVNPLCRFSCGELLQHQFIRSK